MFHVEIIKPFYIDWTIIYSLPIIVIQKWAVRMGDPVRVCEYGKQNHPRICASLSFELTHVFVIFDIINCKKNMWTINQIWFWKCYGLSIARTYSLVHPLQYIISSILCINICKLFFIWIIYCNHKWYNYNLFIFSLTKSNIIIIRLSLKCNSR